MNLFDSFAALFVSLFAFVGFGVAIGSLMMWLKRVADRREARSKK